jgi:hypothetical protein
MDHSVSGILSALAESGAEHAGLRNIVKALSSVNQGTDLSSLTGGGALRVENLDPVLAAATVENKHFKFFNMLLPHRRDSWSMLDQSVRKNDIGGFTGSAVATETGVGQAFRQGDYQRLVTELGIFSVRRNLPLVTAFQGAMQSQAGIVDFSAAEEEDLNAALEILVSVEHSLFYGNKTANPQAIDGLFTQLDANAPANVVDLRGDVLNSHTQMTKLCAKLTTVGAWGSPDKAFMSAMVKADMDDKLEVGYRLNLDSGIAGTTTGVPLRGMRYSSVGLADGELSFDASAFIAEDKKPIGVDFSAQCTIPTAATLTAAAVAPTAPGSKWQDGSNNGSAYTVAGAYHYAVEAWIPGQVSVPKVTSAAATVAVNGAVDLTIGAGGNETYYNIFRSKKAGSNAAADMRFIGTVKRDNSGTTVFRDLNATIPGSSEVPILTSDPKAAALKWIQMLPMTKIPFAMTDFTYPWGAILIGALRINTPKRHGYIKNVIPTAAKLSGGWFPF